MRADDEAGPDDSARPFLDDALAHRLQLAVVLGHVLGVDVPVEWRRLVGRTAEVGVDRSRRDEEVVGRLDQLDRLPHDPGEVARDVHHGVPRAAAEGIELPVAVPAELLDVGEELRVRPAAVEERDLVPPRERRLDERVTDELRPTEDEEPQSSARAASSRSTSSAVL